MTATSAGAELRAQLFFDRSDNARGKLGDLRVGQRRVAALEDHTHHQRIFSRRYILTAKQVARFDETLDLSLFVEPGDAGASRITLAVEGVQFHPESIMTTEGKKLLMNFLKL